MKVTFPAPAPPLNLNSREHWAPRARKTKAWRTAACLAARAAKVGPQGPAAVRVTIPFSRGARRDPHNFVPTVKAVIDGLVDAGLWPDDTPAFVTTVEPLLVIDPAATVVVTVVPRGEIAQLMEV
jgi:crossover junction endodeoxyribonuclease RusA